MTDCSSLIYRKREGSDTWHFISECRWWPNDKFIERNVKPNDGELCNQCRAKSKKIKK